MLRAAIICDSNRIREQPKLKIAPAKVSEQSTGETAPMIKNEPMMTDSTKCRDRVRFSEIFN